VFGPQLFQIVKAADLGPENVDDHIARIDQHPVSLGQAFDAEIAVAVFLQLLHQLVGNGADMAAGSAGCHDHAIGNGRFAGEIDGDDVLGLGIFQVGANGVEERVFRFAGTCNTGFCRA